MGLKVEPVEPFQALAETTGLARSLRHTQSEDPADPVQAAAPGGGGGGGHSVPARIA